MVSTLTRRRDYEYGGNLSPKMMRKEEFVEPRFRKKQRSNNSSKKIKNENCSQNLSPVSVLEVGEEQQLPRKKKDNNSTGFISEFTILQFFYCKTKLPIEEEKI